MTDAEFELIDALYFTLSFEQLQKELGWEEEKVKSELYNLLSKGWVKGLKKDTEEEIESLEEFDTRYSGYLYLASKEGLFRHNSI